MPTSCGSANVRLWLGAEVRAPAWRLPLSGGKQTFDLNVRFSADYVRFSPRSGRIDTVTVESARDPKRSCGPVAATARGELLTEAPSAIQNLVFSLCRVAN